MTGSLRRCSYCNAPDNGTCAYPSENKPGCLLSAHRERMRAALTKQQWVCGICGFTAPDSDGTPTGAPTCPECRVVLRKAPLTAKERSYPAWYDEECPHCKSGRLKGDCSATLRGEIERLQDSINRCSTEEGLCYAVELKRKDNEIERLRGEAEVADEQLAQLRGFAADHQHCERLRAALERYGHHVDHCVGSPFDPVTMSAVDCCTCGLNAALSGDSPSSSSGTAPTVTDGGPAKAGPLAQVAGDYLTTTLAQFMLRVQHYLIEEQEKPNPDNALVALLADAYRLARENGRLATAPLAVSSSGKASGEPDGR